VGAFSLNVFYSETVLLPLYAVRDQEGGRWWTDLEPFLFEFYILSQYFLIIEALMFLSPKNLNGVRLKETLSYSLIIVLGKLIFFKKVPNFDSRINVSICIPERIVCMGSRPGTPSIDHFIVDYITIV